MEKKKNINIPSKKEYEKENEIYWFDQPIEIEKPKEKPTNI